jgi:hypothetical protein
MGAMKDEPPLGRELRLHLGSKLFAATAFCPSFSAAPGLATGTLDFNLFQR